MGDRILGIISVANTDLGGNGDILFCCLSIYPAGGCWETDLGMGTPRGVVVDPVPTTCTCISTAAETIHVRRVYLYWLCKSCYDPM